MTRLFVYGTLKDGHSLHGLLDGATYVQDARANGYTLYQSVIPFMVRSLEQNFVWGELYDVPFNLFEILDVVEGAYSRQSIVTTGGSAMAYIWTGSVKGMEHIGPIFTGGKKP